MYANRGYKENDDSENKMAGDECNTKPCNDAMALKSSGTKLLVQVCKISKQTQEKYLKRIRTS